MELTKELQIECFWLDTRTVEESSCERAEYVADNLRDLRQRYLDFAHACALRQHCAQVEANERKERSRLRAEGHFLKSHESVWSEWRKLAAGAACMALRNYVFALEPIQSKAGVLRQDFARSTLTCARWLGESAFWGGAGGGAKGRRTLLKCGSSAVEADMLLGRPGGTCVHACPVFRPHVSRPATRLLPHPRAEGKT